MILYYHVVTKKPNYQVKREPSPLPLRPLCRSADGGFVDVPYFYFDDGKVKFCTGWVADPSECYGAASGFLRSKHRLLRH
ncbi:MAG TPA: hypothetical protein VJL27_00355 [Patescibacteria group bacterium]|nr:hypothetical protein [Patescibacteria group bacterium]